MKLRDVLKGVNTVFSSADGDIEITGITNDSRKAKEGYLFVAVRGYASDGHKFIASAIKNGASAVLCEEAPEDGGPYVVTDNSRAAEAEAAANFYGRPADKLKMIGVTGTNGKTTVTNLIKSVIEECTGAKVGLIGTNRNMIGLEERPAERTTPDSIELMGLLAEMVEKGCEYCVMEVSSHALYLDRVRSISFEVGAFTNLTEDHLDFHKTMEAYAEAKSRLFSISKHAVINLDDEYSEYMLERAKCPVFTYSTERNDADITAKDIRLTPEGIMFRSLVGFEIITVKLGIPGMFSAYNALTALSVCIVLGIEAKAAANALAHCRGVMGRAEVFPTGRDFSVIIDYAHTPDALSNILRTVRGFAKGRVVLVFGCGGDRDRDKRPIMGTIAGRLADYVYVTSDNPRTEQPMDIIGNITAGMKNTKAAYEVIENRREAIKAAVQNAKTGDVIILAGKGHETYQIIGTEKLHFDEREVLADILSE
ncbi:MAG: UDP-N-acetylmuramoyl-L-alanyl-D-glutamate--2,6-diaminopimelate ligase [Oscillospiraceae bacterium]|nr:UDP-N-acetylmuramoyl-L-alanyl-D-glutamate--2,6-diaminopimelate ligase [Oscillospiraceae bacterium]MBQ3952517.1 UDP-N-acetylmuramoyl-L-alanyl-D-glutamate--2,6-diaminopimelate ligase [Oscillospiraceae bacterium]